MQRGQVRKASVTGPPTGSNSAGLTIGTPGALHGAPLWRVPVQRNRAVAKQRSAQRPRSTGRGVL
jgi:hypothetical protein